MDFQLGPYDPCPCGSGAKYKFCCAAKAKASGRSHGKYPIGTVAYYGPDDQTITKIAAGVVLRENSDAAVLERFHGPDVATDPAVAQKIKQFFAAHGVKSVVDRGGIMGCPHEEGIDFPRGCDCPMCPFWRGKQGTAARSDFDEPVWPIVGPKRSSFEIDDAAEDDAELVDDDDPDLFDEIERDWDASFDRVEAILGDDQLDQEQAVGKLLAHLKANLNLPCEVIGIEDFQWEERYVIGGWPEAEYEELKKTQPSFEDCYQLLSIDQESYSQWMMHPGEDLAAHVRRIGDGKRFVLGLSELEVVDRESPNFQLIDDYAVWFVNNR